MDICICNDKKTVSIDGHYSKNSWIMDTSMTEEEILNIFKANVAEEFKLNRYQINELSIMLKHVKIF